MNRLLLLALTAGLLSPIAAKAERIWLIIDSPHGMQKIEARNMAQCQEQGEIFHKSNQTMRSVRNNMGYTCLKGK